jgi:2-C-methyl-D-erythritol 4-phosphate cytidylyltransferase
MRTFVIILAGGKGSRMDSEIPKQFIPILGKPVIMHTIEKFRSFDPKIEIIVVLPEVHIDLWKEMCNEFKFDIVHSIARGGDERFHSVKNALSLVPENSLVMIHDGVRPLVSHQSIDRVLQKASELGNAIPYIDINESIRKVGKTKSKSVNRNDYKIIQTPQAFKSDLIKSAYEQEYIDSFTDDASVLEAKGESINLVLGNTKNIKITRPVDLIITERLLEDD